MDGEGKIYKCASRNNHREDCSFLDDGFFASLDKIEIWGRAIYQVPRFV